MWASSVSFPGARSDPCDADTPVHFSVSLALFACRWPVDQADRGLLLRESSARAQQNAAALASFPPWFPLGLRAPPGYKSAAATSPLTIASLPPTGRNRAWCRGSGRQCRPARAIRTDGQEAAGEVLPMVWIANVMNGERRGLVLNGDFTP
jgi:hypothetical protein